MAGGLKLMRYSNNDFNSSSRSLQLNVLCCLLEIAYPMLENFVIGYDLVKFKIIRPLYNFICTI